MLKKCMSCIIIMCVAVNIFALPVLSAGSFDEYVIGHLEDFSAEIDITRFAVEYNWTIDECNLEFVRVLERNPQIFFVKTEIVTSYSETNGKIKYLLKDIGYTIRKSQYESKKQEFDNAAEKALRQIDGSMTDFEKALALHDYLALRVKYNNSKPVGAGRTAYDALVGGFAVCQGYAMAYNHLLNLAGIDSSMVSSDSMNHAWSYVKIGKRWYHADVTKDDRLINGQTDSYGRVSHKYFLLSDSALENNGYEDWDSKGFPPADDTRYDKLFFRDVETAMVKLGDFWYYIRFDKNSPSYNKNYKKANADKSLPCYTTYAHIIRCSFEDNSFEKLYTIDSTWFAWGREETSPKSWWSGNYSSLAEYNGLLYFNDAKSIFKLDPKINKVQTISRPKNLDGYIYGLTMDENKIIYTVKLSPSDSNSLKAKTVEEASVSKIELSYKSFTGKIGKSYTVKAELTPSDSVDYVYWESSDTDVATVNQNGKITCKAVGVCTVTAYTANGVYAEVRVKVK